MLWRLVGFHGGVELHRQHRRGVCGLKERKANDTMRKTFFAQLLDTAALAKSNSPKEKWRRAWGPVRVLWAPVQSSPVQSGASVSHWGPGSWSSGSCLPSRAPPGWWRFGSRTLCWAARWPPAELTERRRPPLVWNKVSFFGSLIDCLLNCLFNIEPERKYLICPLLVACSTVLKP